MTPISHPAHTEPEAPPTGHIALLPLLAAIAIMLVITVQPQLLTDTNGRADHLAASCLFWAMAAGFVRGVGFVPRLIGWRWLFSRSACALGLLLAIWRLMP